MSPKILVVNDDPGSLIGLVALLSRWEEELSFETVTARSGEEALRHVLTDDFAVILLDVSMPGMDGFETAETIHSRKASAATPIIFVTAYLADEINRLKGYERGAVDYLFTPIIPPVLKAKLSVFVSLAKKKLELKYQANVLDARTRELTSINRSLEAEIKKRIIAERKNKATEEFLAMLGHELRNPLSAINSAASVLGLISDMQRAAPAVNIIKRQIGQLTRIVDDLLDLSRVMSGKIFLSRQSLDLSKLLTSCIETLTLEGRTQQHRLNLEAEPAYAEVDSVRMEQVITNLLDNALKYTPNGGTIDIKLETVDDQVVLSVRDSGIGIPPALLNRIFDVFVQGERTLDRPHGGLGIGLPLVRQLLTLHGGSVTAHSSGEGTGSVFTVRLPKSVAQEAPAPDAERPSAGCSVLVIEDSEDGRDSMSMMLASFGHRVLTAADGFAALRTATAEKPDIALVDIGLPRMSGYEVARRMRSDPNTSGIKLIALTGYGLESDREQALEAGFDMHLVKPVNPQRLNQAISNFIRQSVRAEPAPGL
jgi:signal transduction histidine kinase